MSERQPPRGERWSGRLGFVLATIGSAVGLGSIWKFPYEVGENGGGAFVLFYLLGLVLVVLPLIFAEFALGRRGRGDAAASVAAVAAEAGRSPRRWAWIGGLAIATGFLILTYYAVVGGLTLAYLLHAIRRGFAGADGAATRALFEAMTGSPAALAAYQAAFLAATVAVVARGVGGGIERACRVLMPLLAALMLGLVAYAATAGDLRRTVAFLLAPRPEALTPRVALEALGLGFFSIGVGLGAMITYAAYAGRDTDLTTAAVATVAGDTAISFLAGFAVFPLVFAHGLDPAEGAGLMFLTLPIAFGRLPFGDAVGAAFFLSLFVAALASAVSLLELAVAPVVQRTGWPRARAAVGAGVVCWLLGLPSVLSFNLWREVRPLGAVPGFATAGLFDAIDRIASNLLLPASGLLLAVFAGWVARGDLLAAELRWGPRAVGALRFLLRWVVPALILAFVALGHLPR
ncbi:sodium-dependent transporter [Caldovatus aquaticus]|uniref:Transporter n=1 Tax=Caldovatus aquaticus TaxID=2865671 RepID=A0ABS7F110_9PROT|nr:sodium-dependent transporter [Caldovatus aquaticus]